VPFVVVHFAVGTAIVAIAVAVACVVGDVAVVTILVMRLASDPSNQVPILLAVAATTASGLRLVGSSWDIRQCLCTLAALDEARRGGVA